jgi:CubicO group peptidase (beta-lactamase class C family)
MMKNILTIILLFFCVTFLFGQVQEHLFFLEADTTWRKEQFIFPIQHARDIDYEGVEDARFPVGWEDQDSPNFWSYVFAWDIEHDGAITATELEVDLQKYFSGLMRGKETSVQISQKTTMDHRTQFTGVVKTIDNFFTKKPMALQVMVDRIYCKAKKKNIILFKFSPKEFGHQVWKKLEEPELPAELIACEETKQQKIYDLVNACFEYGQFNGSVLVAEQGKIIYKNGFGQANKEWDIPNKADTKHRLASVTKQFTAMAIVQLAAENKLKLAAPVTKYLPNYPKVNGDKITIHHLLTHTSGLPNYTSFPNYRETMLKRHSPLDLVELFVDLPLDFAPGAQFAYSNSGYALLGVIIEKITGKTYAQVLQDNIFSPLEMNNTGFDKNREILKNRASGYNKNGTFFENASYINMTAAYAAGALYSTVEDLYLWDQALYTEKLVPQKYLDLLFKKHTSAWGGHYGYGWETGNMRIGQTKEESKTIAHSGGINGFNTRITRFPSEQSVVILLSNTSSAPLHDMTTAINGILHGKPYLFPKRSMAYTLLDTMEKGGIDAGLLWYQKNKASDDYHFNENEMNLSGYQLLGSARAEEAAAILKINTEVFPNSFNAYDSYGEVLLVLGDTTQAIENYKKSVQLNPDNKGGIKILNGLGIKTDDLIIEIPVEHLKLLAGEYQAINQSRDWKIVIEEKDGKLFGNDGGYRYRLNPVGEDRFINPDDGATLVFDAKDKDAITFVIFGKVTFEQVK